MWRGTCGAGGGARHTHDSACQGGPCAVCLQCLEDGVGRDSRRPHGPWGCRAGPEGKWGNPMAASQAASCPPRFKRTERKESPWQLRCGPLSSACACALQILCGACALRVLCGKPRLLPAPFPSCSQPSWYPVAIATLWLPALAGGAAGEDGRVDWPPVGGVGSSSAGRTGRWHPTSLLQGPRDNLRLSSGFTLV